MDESVSFKRVLDAEEDQLRAELKRVSIAIQHYGEGGRSLESYVAELLSRFLPRKFGVTTGFIVGEVDSRICQSPQLDVIIYDSHRCGPLASFSNINVIPIEGALGYVEVTRNISREKLRECFIKNKVVRAMTDRTYWRIIQDGSPASVRKVKTRWTPIRSYIFGFGSEYHSGANLAKAVKEIQNEFGGYFHGIYIGGKGFFTKHEIDKEDVEFDEVADRWLYAEEDGLLTFKLSLLKAIDSMPQLPEDWTPALEQYHQGMTEVR